MKGTAMGSRYRLAPLLTIALLGTVVESPSQAAESCPPARVTGVSYLLDILSTGSSAGPGIIFGVADTVLGNPLPGPAGVAQNELLRAGATVVRTVSTETPAQINALRAKVAFLAQFNSYANAFVEMGADTLDDGATRFGSAIQPFDLTAHEMATMLRETEEKPQACRNAPTTPTGTTAAGRVARALILGQGAQAASLIKADGMAGDASRLARALYLADLAATAMGARGQLQATLAYALPRSGTSARTALQAFRIAATTGVQGTPRSGS